MMSADCGNENACNLLSMESDEFISLSFKIHSTSTVYFLYVGTYMLPCYIIFVFVNLHEPTKIHDSFYFIIVFTLASIWL